MPAPPERALLNRKTWPLFVLGMLILVAASLINSSEEERGPDRFHYRIVTSRVKGLDCGDRPLEEQGAPAGIRAHLEKALPPGSALTDLKCSPPALTARCWHTVCTYRETSSAAPRSRTFYLYHPSPNTSPVLSEH